MNIPSIVSTVLLAIAFIAAVGTTWYQFVTLPQYEEMGITREEWKEIKKHAKRQMREERRRR
jgi:hypothetical protein